MTSSFLTYIDHTQGPNADGDCSGRVISSTWQLTKLTTDKHPCPRRNSNPQSQ